VAGLGSVRRGGYQIWAGECGSSYWVPVKSWRRLSAQPRGGLLDHLVGPADSSDGTSRASAFAVFMLITISNLLACITGSSAGVAPLSTRPGINAHLAIDLDSVDAIALQAPASAYSRKWYMVGTP
jgi:hypothetical protein